MDFEDKFSRNIYDPLRFEMENFTYWMSSMENFILILDFENLFTLKNGFEISKRLKWNASPKNEWIENQIKGSEINDNVIKERIRGETRNSGRVFKVPKFNFDANSFYDYDKKISLNQHAKLGLSNFDLDLNILY